MFTVGFEGGMKSEQLQAWSTVHDETDVPSVSSGSLKQTSSNSVLDLSDRVPKLFRDGLALESFDGVRMSGGGHDDESDDGHLGSHLLKTVIET